MGNYLNKKGENFMRNRVVLFVGRLLFIIGMLCIAKFCISLAIIGVDEWIASTTVGVDGWITAVGLVFCFISIIISMLHKGVDDIIKESVVALYIFLIALSVVSGVSALNIIFGKFEKETVFVTIGLMFGLMALVEIIDTLKRFIKG